MIQTPDHSTFPSGHATEAFTLATVLHWLRTGRGAGKGIRDHEMEFRLAARMATNRTVAGVHFPVDSIAGAALGAVMAEQVLIALGQSIPHPVAIGREIAFAEDDEAPDFNLGVLGNLIAPQQAAAQNEGDDTPTLDENAATGGGDDSEGPQQAEAESSHLYDMTRIAREFLADAKAEWP